MLARRVGQGLFAIAIVALTSITAVSCGSGGSGSVFNDAGIGDDGSLVVDATEPDAYGHLGGDDGGGLGCQKKTCADLGYTCGKNGDGCGGTLDCGTCTAPEFCGGGGYSKCGGNDGTAPDGAPINNCTPATCASLHINCGQTGDGCGGVLSCGSCPATEYCGGGGFNQCGGSTGLLPDGGTPCTPTTCAALGYTCGTAADGCGGALNCGTCINPQYCGGGGFDKCGGNNGLTPDGGNQCTPTTCAALGYTCGTAADGCGGVLNCGTTCTDPQFCGGGGYDKCGGNNGLNPDGSTPCTPATCASLGYTCGVAGDGCGGTLSCGSCTNPQYCGGGGFNKCGGSNGLNPDGGVACTPATCASLGYNCGITGDGCGGSLNCGTCTNPQYCGGGGFDKCGGSNGLNPDGGVVCKPTTCAALGYNCGVAADGCGGTLNCGTCTDPQYCGGGGYDVCGGNNGLSPDGGVACKPTTCAALGYTCGPAGDGCGGQLNCGTCQSPQYCGGAGYDKCGPTNVGGCDGGATTTVTGYVFDPGNNVPVYNVLVYVPVGAVQTPQTGVVPAQCGCTAPPAYASAFTGIDGKFTLTNVPSGSATVVIQLGKWQRVFTKTVTACTGNNLGGGTAGSASNLTLPSTHAQGNIPLFAVDTGKVDTMECVLRKMGIADSEFTDPTIVNGKPTAAGRIHIYKGSIVSGGAYMDNNTPTEDKLTETASVMDSYDVLLFPCQGNAGSYTAGNGWPNTLGNLLNYTAVGGRAFTTHFHYDLLEGNGSFNNVANWVGDTNQDNGPDTGYINTTGFARANTLAQWLNQSIVYGGTFGQIPVGYVRQDFSSVNAPALLWMSTQAPNPADMPIHMTFDTPFNQSPTCGRVVYSDFHVENSGGANVQFPTECAGGGLTAQEKLLEFMLFDLTSCVSPPTCTPLTCAQQNITCGPAGDGCGGSLNCGNCVAPQTCGGGGVGGQCGYPDAGSCTPKTCAQLNINCGPAGDGCGGSLNCGNCTAPQTCGGGGVYGQCGYPDGGSCKPQTCGQQNINCGPAGDGCGGSLSCGNCTPPQTCGGGGHAGQCGYPDGGSCVPETCAQQNINCGPAGDGCGGSLSCGICVAPQTCGGGGHPGQCGAPDAGSCNPETCAQQNIGCGPAGDGCGNVIQCGTCQLPQTCGGGGVPSQCGAPDAGACSPQTCQQQNIGCGPAGDGCGNQIDCGTCPAGQTCGGGGTPGQCGHPDGGACVPETCSVQHIDCGPAGDGCGNLIQCGPCTSPQTCGGGGTPGQCGEIDAGSCVPLTCKQLGIQCGPAGDGCGNLIQCGTCVAPQTCGGGGTPGVCGGGSQ
jgi:hypothetical protein